jgi:hypothetical protein
MNGNIKFNHIPQQIRENKFTTERRKGRHENRMQIEI